MRTELIAAFNVWIKVPPEELATITKVIKMLHTASLLYVYTNCPGEEKGAVLSVLICPALTQQSVVLGTDPPFFVCVYFQFMPIVFARVDDIEDDSVLRRGEPGNAFCSKANLPRF
jgi:hypothetical protein